MGRACTDDMDWPRSQCRLSRAGSGQCDAYSGAPHLDRDSLRAAAQSAPWHARPALEHQELAPGSVSMPRVDEPDLFCHP